MIVRVKWIDAQFVHMGGLVRMEDLKNIEPVKCEIVGHLLKETKDIYIIAKELWGDGSFKYVHVIPKKIVEEIVVMKDGEDIRDKRQTKKLT